MNGLARWRQRLRDSDHQRRREVARQLCVGHVHRRTRRRPQAGRMGVADDADNLQVSPFTPDRRREVLPDRILTWKVSLRVGVVDDRHGRSPGDVTLGEFPPSKQSSPHYLEEAGPGADEQRGVDLRDRLSRGHRRFTPHRSTQRRVGRDADGDDAGHAPHLVEQICRQRRSPRIEVHEQNALGGKSRINRLKIAERADEEAGADQQHYRERDLADHEAGQKPRRRPAHSGIRTQDRSRRRRRGLERRREAEADGRGNRRRRGEAEHARIRSEIECDLDRAGREQVDQQTANYSTPMRGRWRHRSTTAACSRSASAGRLATGWRPSRGEQPSLAVASRPAPGADWRRSRRRSAGRRPRPPSGRARASCIDRAGRPIPCRRATVGTLKRPSPGGGSPATEVRSAARRSAARPCSV